MSIYRTAARNDDNQAELIALAEKLGARIWVIRKPVDLLAFIRGRWVLVECKCAPGPRGGVSRGGLTEDQQQFIEECRRISAPVLIWREPRDVYETMGAKEC